MAIINRRPISFSIAIAIVALTISSRGQRPPTTVVIAIAGHLNVSVSGMNPFPSSFNKSPSSRPTWRRSRIVLSKRIVSKRSPVQILSPLVGYHVAGSVVQMEERRVERGQAYGREESNRRTCCRHGRHEWTAVQDEDCLEQRGAAQSFLIELTASLARHND